MAQKAVATDDAVLLYLARVLDATATLCLTENQEACPSTTEQQNGGDLIRQIAQNLLRAGNAELLSTPLPPPLVELERQKEDALSRDRGPPLRKPEDEKERIPDWKRNRSDYVRCLLRSLPPIALDVVAEICSLVTSQVTTDEGTIPLDIAVATFVLFSKWLPIAPQIAPLVSDLFSLDIFPCPLEYGTSNDDSDDKLQLLVFEASHAVYEYYAKRGEHSTMNEWWSWGHLFTVFTKNDNDVVMKDATNDTFDCKEAIAWHAARAIGFLLDLRPAAFAAYLDRLHVRNERVPWVPHPWMVDKEDERAQFRALRGVVSLFDWKNDEFPIVSSDQIRSVVPLHSLLVHVGEGIVLVKNNAVRQLVARNDAMEEDRPRRRNLILTPTTSENFALLGAAMCSDPYPLPILVCGPPGAGKSSLIRELAHYCCATADDLLELHVDEETDSKTLIGSYTTTDIPGEFTWRPGALTQAVRSGKWVVMEDVDTVPMEIQAAIVQLLEDRMLPLGGGKFERCHPTFRLFGTCTTNSDYRASSENATEQARTLRLAGKKLLNSSLWRKVHVKPLAFSELKQVGESLHPFLPSVVTEAALNVFRALDTSGRSHVSSGIPPDPIDGGEEIQSNSAQHRLVTGRHASVRDFLKLLSRISNTVAFEHNIGYATEAQRTLCLAETVDVFAASCPSAVQKRIFITQVAAPHWGVTGELALQYMEARQPAVTRGSNYTEIGRAKIPNAAQERRVEATTERFAPTNFVLRLMESIGVCITENEPALLVGETGCGKTSLLQQLARYTGRELIVQNLSLQTDSTDLLGGYRPLEIPHIARKVYLEFVDIFVATFSRKQNAEFLKYTSSTLQKKQWKKLAQCFTRAATLGLAKIKDRTSNDPNVPGLAPWKAFAERAEQFERQRLACDSGLAFAFTEGALVDAIRSGKWVLLDEINLASSETLQRLCGLLDDSTASVTLTERGDSHALKRHPDFRLFAAMNPATDAGKKDLPTSIRARFSELYVDELLDAVELRTVAAQYLRGVVSVHDTPLEQTETIGRAVDIYLQCRDLAEEQLVDASGLKPRYTMRTMCRALSATCNLVTQQKLALGRSMLEGFELAFEGALDSSSSKAVHQVLRSHIGKKYTRNEMDHPSRRPSNGGVDDFVLVKPFWLKAGPLDPVDWSEGVVPGRSKFILTESMSHNLRRLSRAVAAGPWPVLLEGPTSAGKTTLVEYLAARCGHEVVRINNHEHTDVQEYTGGYSSDSNGSLSFHDGLLVRALRRGHWVILDELNLAPSEVLEALNRLLDDNRELYLPEIDEVVKPHPNFRLFATQNPSGAYGGRKPLSRAFRNRFVELHMGDISAEEMKVILEKRCSCPPSHAKALVKVMVALRQRRNAHGVFLGKDGLITPRDLLRWAERGGSSKLALAQEGYMLLAERLRNEDEKAIIKEEIESHLNVAIDCDELYYGMNSEARAILDRNTSLSSLSSVAFTKSLLRLLTLVVRCTRQKEPVLLVGETGCGKTTVVQLLSEILDRDLHTVNCHATTETSDLIGGLRPVRGRGAIALEIQNKLLEFLSLYPAENVSDSTPYIELRALIDSGIENGEECGEVFTNLSDETILRITSLVETLYCRLSETNGPAQSLSYKSVAKESKKRKLDSGVPLGVFYDPECYDDVMPRLEELVESIGLLARRISCLFEWADGPLVNAMRTGQLLLLDEMSLAEDAVLERLNSVLEPSRTLVLAEKSTDAMDEVDGNTIVSHDGFRIFATMNPGGDFGKRELSPALRSRFTEIWVPQVTDASDIELVLGHTLARASVRCDGTILSRKILNYVNFFNKSICGEKSSPCFDLALSLRDVLTWAHFVVDVSNSNEDMDLWALYCHGACLMHLDGLGLGTGLSAEDVWSIKSKAVSFLLNEVPVDARYSSETLFRAGICQGLVRGERFGIHPFTIETGEHPVPESSFDFDAPTPSLNLLRLLRAMQISKPILLEGSPGVGKTSLATALAATSGHRLVRINLSEQTDISDLIGSDLPNPEHDGDSGSSFRWCDGVLLRAIKQGDWVLLDELNLASQSVLEGLNSCLDHRASVFIPELGKTFHCPPTFRIFAAQNPLAQGGGRKGLPKSFLNRFTKVYVESLTEDDLHTIVSKRFPTVTPTLAKSMISFNKSIHEEVVDRREYGGSGSPWEFNLRDVFRWCELVVATNDTSVESIARFARHLYLERFRTAQDRMRFDCSYRKYFGVSLFELPPPEFGVTDANVSIGRVALHRRLSHIDMSSGQVSGEDSVVLRSLLGSLEAVASCVTMKWPCLLVGVTGSGKSSLLKSLAELGNAPLVNVSLTPATDVNELVGSFEQVDSDKDQKDIIRYLRLLRNAACTYLTKSNEESMLQQKVWRLHRTLQDASLNELVKVGFEIASILTTASELNQEFHQHAHVHLKEVQAILERLEDTPGGKMERGPRHFRWVDGILVTAMTHGYWLHLENVNLCPASVLDRLNSVMEKGGELLLTECGVRDEGATGASHQIVKQHPDFRIFLSMNPENGEISRAMRNRCVEISLVPYSCVTAKQELIPATMPNRILDNHDLLYSSGIRSMQVADSMLVLLDHELAFASNHGSEPPSGKHVREWGQLVRGLSIRGLNCKTAIETSCRLAYELGEDQSNDLVPWQQLSGSRSEDRIPLMQIPFVRWDWSFHPYQARRDLELRLVKVCSGDDEISSNLLELPLVSTFPSIGRAETDKNSALALNARHMQKNFLSLYLGKSSFPDLSSRSETLDGYSSASSDNLRFMASLLGKAIVMSQYPSGYRSVLQNDGVIAVHLQRLTQLLEEQNTHGRIAAWNNQSGMNQLRNPLEASVCLAEGRIDRSLVSCPATPMLYPFFRAVDEWIHQLIASPECEEWIRRNVDELKNFLIQRDQLWMCLQQCTYDGSLTSSFLGFDERGFIVQWIWLKKKMNTLLSEIPSACFQDTLINKLKQHVEILVEAMDRVLFNTGDGISQSGEALWKKGGHPLVPRQSSQWEAMALLNRASREYTLMQHATTDVTIELQDLIENSSPVLFLGTKKKGELLAALCMCFWTSTDEAPCGDHVRSSYENQELCATLSEELNRNKRAFALQVRLSKVDTEITTVENRMGVESLSKLRESDGHYDNGGLNGDFLRSLLFRFAQIQVSPLAEFWCVREEEALIESLAEALVSADTDIVLDRVRSLVPRFRVFIDVVLAHTCISVADVRPYQTLLWFASDSGANAESTRSLLRCLFPRMMNTISRHNWINSFNSLDVISDKLEMPSLWICDETDSVEATNTSTQDESQAEFRRGPPGLKQSVKSQVMFRLIGSAISSMLRISSSSSYATIENHVARKKQAQTVLSMFSTLKLPASKDNDLYQVQYLFVNAIESLFDFFPGESGSRVLSILRDSEVLQSVDEGIIRKLLATCKHREFIECLESVVFPLLSSLRSVLNGVLPAENRAHCWIYVGLLRMSLLVPRSPLDPGTKPAAKVVEYDRYLDELESKIVAIQLDSHCVQGVPPNSPAYHGLTSEMKRIQNKRIKQDRKRVERVPSAPAFIDFFREAQRYFQTTIGPEGVPALVRAISESARDKETMHIVRTREHNWQVTSSSFCSRLLDHFAAYEDVVVPFVNAIENVRDGVRLLAAGHLLPNDPGAASRRIGFKSLLAFPSGNIFARDDRAKTLLSNISAIPISGSRQQADLKRCRFGISLALLYQLNVQKHLQGGRLEYSAVSETHSIFNSVATAWSNERDGISMEPADSAEALLEEEYREQFPDHQHEFRSLLHTIDMGEESFDVHGIEESRVSEEDWRLNDDQIAILCSLHRDIYMPSDRSIDDTMRTRTLCAAYSAAFHLTRIDPTVLGDSVSVADAGTVGAHITVVGLCSRLAYGSLLDSERFGHFHRDPNPKEVARAARPLEMLISRTTQLLSAFPGHPVLIALVRVADHCSKLSLSATSIGKVMHGLEIILRRAQEWEEHASNLVKLGRPLQDVSELVASWRKLELQSWSTLLDSRGHRFAKRARRHWPRLYTVLVSGTGQNDSSSPSTLDDWDVEAPTWVWKSLKNDVVGRFSDSATGGDVNAVLVDLSRVMDTFLLSSPVGEFKERLRLVETFGNQVSLMQGQSRHAEPSRGEVGRMLFSLASFYRQFVPMIESRLSELRRPIEARLKDEARLAKWDEQSYYALRESTEKNHRKLMKLLREYDDILELSVSSILEKHLCHGVRAAESSTEEPSRSIPSHKTLFPYSDWTMDGNGSSVTTESKSFALCSDRAWVDPEMVGLSCDKYVSRMDHYARRMASLLQMQDRDALVWSRVGSDNTSTLCETIFERIESLRRDSSTKAMKQRALVDLFKTLKKHGFCHTKWSVPEEVRDMARLLQLPRVVDTSGILSPLELQELEGAELYFQRTTAEVNRLRSEVQMLGSRHMSQRETQIMLSFSEHGLTMICQQRCVLARLLKQFSSLDKMSERCEDWDRLPLCQNHIRNTLKGFNTAFLSVTENLKQLRLLMKTTLPLVEESNKAEAIRDIISLIDASISSLGGYRAVEVSTAVTFSDISSAMDAVTALQEIRRVVVQCQESCRKSLCLPPEIFCSSLDEIRRACGISSGLLNQMAPCDNDDTIGASHVMNGASVAIQKVLLGVQALCRDSIGRQEAENDTYLDDEAIFDCHSLAIKELAAIDLAGITEASAAVMKMLLSVHESDTTATTQRDCCTSVVSGTSSLIRRFLQVTRERLVDYIKFSRNLAKLNYILVRVFRVLVSKGFCADSITNDEGDGEGDISGMNFDDDNDGTGMGEGDGKQDVTDQLESEEQLLGLKGEDQNGAPTEQQEFKELNEEEAKQGMEMEGDFNGDMFDVPEEAQDDERDGNDDEEELDREMGQGPDQNDDIIDEKMWDESDDEGDQNPADEKFEKDSGVTGESIQDELRTREDDEAKKAGDGDTEELSHEAKPSENDAGVDESMEDEPQINEDSEDKYEEKTAGVDVRDEHDADEKDDGGDEPMELEDSLTLDEGSEGDPEEGDDAMDTEDQPVEETNEGAKADPNLVAEEEDGMSDSESSKVDADIIESGLSKSERNEDAADGEDDNDQTEDNDDEDTEITDVQFSGNDGALQEAEGIQSKDGKDCIKESMDDDDKCEGSEEKDKADEGGDKEESQPQASSGGISGESGDAGDQGDSVPDGEMDEQEQDTVSAPNPFQNPGDATKFWHKKLRMLEGIVDEEENEAADEATNDDYVDQNGNGEFEFAPKDQTSSTQVLGEADEEEAARIDDVDEENPDESAHQSNNDTKSSEGKDGSPRERKRPKKSGQKSGAEQQTQIDEEEGSDSADEADADEHMDDKEPTFRDEPCSDDEEANVDDIGNRVVTDLSQLNVSGKSLGEGERASSLAEDEGCVRVTDDDLAAARSRWSYIQGETHHLSRRLCEKLRLVMEPLVATKLKGDYRTGKRINMKRVIGYIASGYRKDKIWLRRTKPAKRNYRVLLAVDNSESMHKSGAGEMAVAAMATLAVGMSQLEIGELGVASFGEEMRLLHPFHQPFTSESGVNVVQNFPFDEKRTRTALCVESAISALETQGDEASMQLVFLISDGRIERDSRDNLRRLVRELAERNVLLVMIIVEGDKNGPVKKKDSIVHMKEVTFKNGKPIVKQFIEDYPFPYYMVLEDMQSLPELLGGALSQWFEMLAQIQGTTR